MKTKVVFLVLYALVALAAIPALADDEYVYANADQEIDVTSVEDGDDPDTKFKFTGQVRARYEYLWNYFGDNTEDDSDNFDLVPYRAQVGLLGQFTNNVHGYVDLQAFGNFGDSIPDRSLQDPFLQSGDTDFLDSGQVNVYQAFLNASQIGGTKFDLRVGRAEHILGNELHMGNSSFYNGLSFDGARAWYNSDRWNVQGYMYWVTERNAAAPGDLVAWGGFTSDFLGTGGPVALDSGNVDARHGGVDFTWMFDDAEQHQLTLYVLQTASRNENAFSAIGFGDFVLDTAGVLWRRAVREERGLDWSVELATQFGTALRDTPSELDFGGSIFEGSVGWKFGPVGRVRLGALVASGDDDSSDMNIDAYVPLFADAHHDNRLGNLDLFGGNLFTGPSSALSGLGGSVSMSNVTNLNLRYELERGKSYFMVALHDFTFTEEVDISGTPQDSIGQEIDLEYRFQYTKNLAWDIAYSYLIPGDLLDAVMAPDSAEEISRIWLQGRLTW